MNVKTIEIQRIIAQALREDGCGRDATTRCLIPKTLMVEGRIVSRRSGVIAGLPIAEEVFRMVHSGLAWEPLVNDGDPTAPNQTAVHLRGRAASILSAERTALNFLIRLSGIATLTAAFVEAIRGTDAKIMDTRKTTPGIRVLEKYAVRVGGGYNHRLSLADQILIKDNHLEALETLSSGGRPIEVAVQKARKGAGKGMPIEIEVRDLVEFEEAMAVRPDVILLDNFKIRDLASAVALRNRRGRRLPPKPLLEASGGVRLENVRLIAETGVDMISAGALTHSARALDFALELD